jgi:hypothetical protein
LRISLPGGRDYFAPSVDGKYLFLFHPTIKHEPMTNVFRAKFCSAAHGVAVRLSVGHIHIRNTRQMRFRRRIF